MEAVRVRGKSCRFAWPFAKRLVLGVSFLVLVSCSSPPVTPHSSPAPQVPSLPIVPSVPVPGENAVRTPVGAATIAIPMATKLVATEAATVTPQSTQHTVQPGETLLGLAFQYQVPMAAIQLRNQLGSETTLQAGQALDIPPAAEWEGASPFWVVYRVPEGATLSGIAALYDLDLATLRAVNGMANDDLLIVGQPLILPLEVPAHRDASAEVARAPDPTSPSVLPVAAPAPTPEIAQSPWPTTELEESPPLPREPLSTDVAAWPAEVFRLINVVRAEHGLSPYLYNETLAQAAGLHGRDCQQRGSCNHTGSDGSNVKTRILRAGYDAAGWAECIVYSYSPQEAVDWWMDEVPPNDAHRRTLLSTWVTEIGIAVVPTGWDYYYFIADFGRPN